MKGTTVTRYLVTDTDIEHAINDAIDAQNKDRQGNNYVISNSLDVVNHVLKLLNKSKVAESEQTENPKQDDGREIDTSEYPVVDLEVIKAADLVDIICKAYQKGKDYRKN